jgi:hypothetical protein
VGQSKINMLLIERRRVLSERERKEERGKRGAEYKGECTAAIRSLG